MSQNQWNLEELPPGLIGSFVGDEGKIDEVDEQIYDEDDLNLSTGNYERPTLDPISQAKLQSCIEQLEDILGDSCHERTAVEAVLSNNFDVEKALNQLLNKNRRWSTIAPPPSWSPPTSASANQIPSASKSATTKMAFTRCTWMKGVQMVECTIPSQWFDKEKGLAYIPDVGSGTFHKMVMKQPVIEPASHWLVCKAKYKTSGTYDFCEDLGSDWSEIKSRFDDKEKDKETPENKKSKGKEKQLKKKTNKAGIANATINQITKLL